VPGPTAPPLGSGRLGGHLARDAGAGLGQLLDSLGDVVLAEVAEVGAESVGLDAVDPGGEIGLMHGPDDVGPGDVEDLVTTLVPLEVVECGPGVLEHRPHRPVSDDDAFFQGETQGLRAGAHDSPLYRRAGGLFLLARA
jgi:hypothetical protein